jgi:putative NADH-flavin reductase
MAVQKVLVLGATGGTGRALIVQAAAGGFSVTALVRHPQRLPPGIGDARVIEGDILEEPDALTEALRGQDAVISALGVGRSLKSNALISRVAPLLVDAMSAAGVRRLVFTSAFGVGSTRNDVPLLPRLFIATVLRDIYEDKEAGEKAIAASGLDWTLVCPVGLTNGGRTGRYRVGEHLPLSGFPRISRADVADCLLRQVQTNSFIRKRVLVAPD